MRFFVLFLLIPVFVWAQPNPKQGYVAKPSLLSVPVQKPIPIPSHKPLNKNKKVPSLPSKSLFLKSIHTGETVRAVFWKDGAYMPAGLEKLNKLLRDHRDGSVVRMDPELFMIVHRLYHDTNAHGPIEVISGHRSRRTNEMLRRQGRKVAKRSQHVLGKAMDIRLKGVSLKKARNIALSYGLGGVGYYPSSNFIHIDTGRPRFW